MTDTHVCGWIIEDEYTSVDTTEDGSVIFQVVKIKETEEKSPLLMRVHLSAKEASMLSRGLATAVAQLGEKGSKGALQPPTPPLESLITEEMGAKN